ncbi:DUF1129 family protein [Levilactobacillus tongjiangensis]|uniref:DUF1129 family protein n=1 Tax=Levilactobacillus tongjiangensis TaxID=2486023 RepID=A0ABW1SPT1_9LACO|nr:DUF1129 family protein [Levilactobacillus tongjiangensis]
MSDNKETPRNAGVHQNRNTVASNERAAFDNVGLTKRNADYMFRFNKALEKTKLTPEKKAAAVQKMVAELVDGQKSGATAKNLYGDVDARVKEVVEGPEREVQVFGGPDYWPNMIYNALSFFMIFNLMFGVLYLFSPNLVKESNSPIGISAIIISAIGAGFIMPIMPKLFDPKIKHKYNGWIRLLIVLGGFLIWMVLFFFAQLMPRTINPVLGGWPSLMLAVFSGIGMYWIRRHYKITGGFFG